MAMRPRAPSGLRAPTRAVFRQAVYEDFRPFSEWKQVEGADVLLIHLPGFMREQIKLTSEPTNTIKARGERLLANNAWSRFNQNYRIPENCDASGIHAKFEGGILYITMPKNIREITPKTATTNLQAESLTTTNTEPQKIPDKDGMAKVDTTNQNPIEKDMPKFKGETRAEPPSPKDDDTDTKRLTPKDKQTTPKTEKVETIAEKIVESIIGKTVSTEPTAQSIQDDRKTTVQKQSVQNVEQVTPKPQKSNEDPKTIVDKPTTENYEPDQTNPQLGNFNAVKSENINKETNGNSTHEGNLVKQLLKKTEKTNEHNSNSQDRESAKEHNLDVKKQSGGDEIESLKKIVKEFGIKIKEEKEALINIGVAVIVIVSLGVYVSYTTFGNGRN